MKHLVQVLGHLALNLKLSAKRGGRCGTVRIVTGRGFLQATTVIVDGMLTTRPYFTTFRPSSTTVSFTVSTNLRPQTWASHFNHWLLLALRIVLGLLSLSVLTAKYLQSSPTFSFTLFPSVATLPWMYIAPISFGTLVLAFRKFQTGMYFIIPMSTCYANNRLTFHHRRGIAPHSSLSRYSDY